MALIHNSKNFNSDYQFLIEEKYLNEFPDLLKWVNSPLLQFFIFYPFTATIENGIVTNIDEYNYALIYEWPHASDEKNDQSNKKKGFSRLSETTIGPAEYLNDCYVLIKSESLYDPTNGRDSDGFVYVDICGNHSPIGDLEIEALNKLKKSDN